MARSLLSNPGKAQCRWHIERHYLLLPAGDDGSEKATLWRFLINSTRRLPAVVVLSSYRRHACNDMQPWSLLIGSTCSCMQTFTKPYKFTPPHAGASSARMHTTGRHESSGECQHIALLLYQQRGTTMGTICR